MTRRTGSSGRPLTRIDAEVRLATKMAEPDPVHSTAAVLSGGAISSTQATVTDRSMRFLPTPVFRYAKPASDVQYGGRICTHRKRYESWPSCSSNCISRRATVGSKLGKCQLHDHAAAGQFDSDAAFGVRLTTFTSRSHSPSSFCACRCGRSATHKSAGRRAANVLQVVPSWQVVPLSRPLV